MTPQGLSGDLVLPTDVESSLYSGVYIRVRYLGTSVRRYCVKNKISLNISGL